MVAATTVKTRRPQVDYRRVTQTAWTIRPRASGSVKMANVREQSPKAPTNQCAMYFMSPAARGINCQVPFHPLFITFL